MKNTLLAITSSLAARYTALASRRFHGTASLFDVSPPPLRDAMDHLIQDVVAALRDHELTFDAAFSTLMRLDAAEQDATAELIEQLATADAWEEMVGLDVSVLSTPAQLLYNGACAWRSALVRGAHHEETRVNVRELLHALGALCEMREITPGALALRTLPHIHRALEQCESTAREAFETMMRADASDAPRLALRIIRFACQLATKYTLRVTDVNDIDRYSQIASGVSEMSLVSGIEGARGILRQLAALTIHRILRPSHSVREDIERYLHVNDAGDLNIVTLDLNVLAKMTVSHLGTGRPITDAQFNHLRQMMPNVSPDTLKELTIEAAKRIGYILKRARDDKLDDDIDERAAPWRAPAAA